MQAKINSERHRERNVYENARSSSHSINRRNISQKGDQYNSNYDKQPFSYVQTSNQPDTDFIERSDISIQFKNEGFRNSFAKNKTDQKFDLISPPDLSCQNNQDYFEQTPNLGGNRIQLQQQSQGKLRKGSTSERRHDIRPSQNKNVQLNSLSQADNSVNNDQFQHENLSSENYNQYQQNCQRQQVSEFKSPLNKIQQQQLHDEIPPNINFQNKEFSPPHSQYQYQNQSQFINQYSGQPIFFPQSFPGQQQFVYYNQQASSPLIPQIYPTQQPFLQMGQIYPMDSFINYPYQKPIAWASNIEQQHENQQLMDGQSNSESYNKQSNQHLQRNNLQTFKTITSRQDQKQDNISQQPLNSGQDRSSHQSQELSKIETLENEIQSKLNHVKMLESKLKGSKHNKAKSIIQITMENQEDKEIEYFNNQLEIKHDDQEFEKEILSEKEDLDDETDFSETMNDLAEQDKSKQNIKKCQIDINHQSINEKTGNQVRSKSKQNQKKDEEQKKQKKVQKDQKQKQIDEEVSELSKAHSQKLLKKLAQEDNIQIFQLEEKQKQLIEQLQTDLSSQIIKKYSQIIDENHQEYFKQMQNQKNTLKQKYDLLAKENNQKFENEKQILIKKHENKIQTLNQKYEKEILDVQDKIEKIDLIHKDQLEKSKQKSKLYKEKARTFKDSAVKKDYQINELMKQLSQKDQKIYDQESRINQLLFEIENQKKSFGEQKEILDNQFKIQIKNLNEQLEISNEQNCQCSRENIQLKDQISENQISYQQQVRERENRVYQEMNENINQIEQGWTVKMQVKEHELNSLNNEHRLLKEDFARQRKKNEEDRINLEKIKNDLSLAKSHIVQLQEENILLNDDVDRLQKVAQGLEQLNKQFNDLEQQSQQERKSIFQQKDKELEQMVIQINEKNQFINSFQINLEKLENKIQLKDQELDCILEKMGFKDNEIEQLRQEQSNLQKEINKQKLEIEKKDKKYNDLREMSQKCMIDQKNEFEKCLEKLKGELKQKEQVENELKLKLDENLELEKKIIDLQDKLQSKDWVDDSRGISQNSLASTNPKHSSFILERMNRFDQDMLKHSKRNQKLMHENILLKNQIAKFELQVQNLNRKLVENETEKVRNSKAHSLLADI